MTKIVLDILRLPHPPAHQIGHPLHAVRIVTHIALKSATGWTTYRPGVVDTGAAVSLLPRESWESAEYQVVGEVRIGGINARPECRIAAKLSNVTIALSDGQSVIGQIPIRAYLADSNEVPLLIGLCDLLERGRLMID